MKEKGIKPININDYPAIKKHLDGYYTLLEKRSDKGDTPYNLRNCAYIEDFYLQKIVWKAVGRNLAFSILEEGKFLTAPASFITSNYNNYLLGFLCSSFAKFYIYNNSDTTGAGDIMLNIQSLENIPIPKIVNTKEIENIVIAIIENKKNNLDTLKLEKKIDNLVYKMYEFTNKEIEFIENV